MSGAMLHGLGDCTPERHCGCLADAAATGEYREVWDASVPPGGFICSICQMPVESEPCPEHAPERPDLLAALGAAVDRARDERKGADQSPLPDMPPPPSDDAECCASGRREVCSPGYEWGAGQ